MINGSGKGSGLRELGNVWQEGQSVPGPLPQGWLRSAQNPARRGGWGLRKVRCQAGSTQHYLRRGLPAGLKLQVGAQGPDRVGQRYYPSRSKAALTLVKKPAQEAGWMVTVKE